ncbi:glycosyltransferase family 39 protein [Lysinibacillus telephonicus]|uniref:glycosyltransferase family 39 protein n=1 Tax=Lysinibacillus telephonicus TaxID=1714840 RepID=UPI0031FDC116
MNLDFFKKNIDLVVFFVLLSMGFTLRLLWILNVPNEPFSDFQTYYEIAISIVNGETHSLMGYQGIGYPFILSVIFSIFNSTDIFIAKFFNVILSTVTLVLIYLISIKLLKNKWLSLLVLLLVTLLPNYIAYNNIIGTETFFVFLFTLILVLYLYNFNNKARLPLLGIIIGFAALTKPQFMIYPILLMIILFLKNKNLKESLVFLGVVGIFTAAVISPMAIINYNKFNKFIPISYNGGYVLYINNNDQNNNGKYMDVNAVTPSEEILVKFAEKNISYGELSAKASDLYKEQAMDWIKEHPITFIKLGLLRIDATFFSGASDIQDWSMSSFNMQLQEKMPWNEYARNIYLFEFITDTIVYTLSMFGFIFSFLGLYYIIKKFLKMEIPYIISLPSINILFFVLICFVFEGQSRYNYPVLFLFIIALVICLDKLLIGYKNMKE